MLADNRDLCLPHLHWTSPLKDSRNIPITFAAEKLQRCGYPMVKNPEDVFIRFDKIHESDRRTDGHRMTEMVLGSRR